MVPLVSLHVSLVMDKIIMKSRRMRWARHVARMKQNRNVVRNPERKVPLGGPKHRWVNNIKMDLREIGFIWLRTGTTGGLL
jgi:hypothetical protein